MMCQLNPSATEHPLQQFGVDARVLNQFVVLVDGMDARHDEELVVRHLVLVRLPPGARLADQVGLTGIGQPARERFGELFAFQSRLEAQEGVVGLPSSGEGLKSGISFSM